MRWLHKLSMRVAMLFSRTRAGENLNDELEFHLEQQIAENVAAGMDAEEARYAALRSFGNPAALRDQTRESWSWNWLESLWRDVKYSLRTLRRTPGFATVAVTVIALGIGANVALFTVVHSVLLNPLPFHDQHQLVRVFEADAQGRFQDNIVDGGSFGVWRSQAHSFSQLAVKQWINYNLSGAGGQLPEVVTAQTASWNLFPLLGVQPALGRLFTAEDDRPGAPATIVLSWGLWKRRYGSDPAILGKTISLEARPYTVIGVLPAWFAYPDSKVQLWTPLYHEKSAELMGMFEAHNFDVVGRLKPDVTMQQASAEINSIQAAIRLQHPNGPVSDAANLRPILEVEVRHVKTGLYVLLAATGCLLLIACLNIANLLVARAASRRREAAIRTALGGTRARLIREQVIESVLLSVAGGLLGLLLAALALEWLTSVRNDIPRAGDIHISGIVVLFSFAVMLACGLVAGLIPALSSSRAQILTALQESSRSSSGGRDRTRLRRTLLSLEIALTVVLLTGAGLLLKSYSRLHSVNPGCATQNVLTMQMSLSRGSYGQGTKRVAFFEQLLERVRSLPGVQAAGLTTAVPGEERNRDDVFTIPEHPPLPQGQVQDASTRFVDPGYFDAMRIPLLSGRTFLPDERFERAQSVVINQEFAHQFFPGEDPLGKHIIVSGVTGDNRVLQIVGVCGITLEAVSSPPNPAVYYPLYSGMERFATLVVRSKGSDPALLALPIQKVIASIDRDLPVSNIRTMNQVIGQSIINESFNAKLLLAFAMLSLLLAAVGLFGVLSYIIAQRTTEIGVRIALGAQREHVMKLMLLDGMRPALFGLAIGLIASLGLTRLIASMLFGTEPFDALVVVAVSALLLLVAFAACVLPAWRASQLDPVQALRSE